MTLAQPPTPRTKICGLRSLDTARAALVSGADYLGFNFYPMVRRYIPPETARAIIDALRAEVITAGMVGLFVNADPAEIATVAATAGLDAVHLSGHEPPAALAALAALGLPVLKTLHLPADATRDSALATIDDYLVAAAALPHWPHGARLTVLLEPAVSGQYGGTGRTADWTLAAALAAVHPCGLAGGLTPDNVSAAITTVRPWLVDVSSGVETDGDKDPTKIAAFLAAARGVAPVSVDVPARRA